MRDCWIRAADVRRYYRRGPQTVRAVDGVDLEVGRGELLAVTGASGSGKSTLLNLLAGLDTPTAGRIEVEGRPLGSLSRRELAAYRARRVGIIFQFFHLIPHLTALQNVEAALLFLPVTRRERRRRAAESLERLGLADRIDHRPADLSGGEQQRVAAARALVKEPEALFADEPTGNLDRENAGAIADLLSGARDRGLAVVLVSHDGEMAGRIADRVVTMRYGRIRDDGGPGR
ncbi:MAG: ABC transporter ATP-binding protein [Candidatus Eisenbacteria bacterium]|nr:ABC transporter ATP-binding protein [Candidatus Eisenbacteria bacterium]